MLSLTGLWGNLFRGETGKGSFQVSEESCGGRGASGTGVRKCWRCLPSASDRFIPVAVQGDYFIPIFADGVEVPSVPPLRPLSCLRTRRNFRPELLAFSDPGKPLCQGDFLWGHTRGQDLLGQAPGKPGHTDTTTGQDEGLGEVLWATGVCCPVLTGT